MAAEGEQRGRRWLTVAALGAILAVAAALRFAALARAPLWWDEGNNAYFAQATLPELLRMSRLTLDTDPPAHRLALKVWLWLTGDGALQLRAFSALCGVLGVGLVAVWGRGLYGRRTGLVAAGMAAIWPAFVYYSREGKPYALIVLCACLSVYLWQRYLDQAVTMRWWAWLGAVACAALALGAHYYVALFMAAQGLGLAIALIMERPGRELALQRLGRWLSVQVTAVALVAPWVALTFDTALQGAAILPEVSAQRSLWEYGAKLAVGLVAGPWGSRWMALAAAALLSLAALVEVVGGRRRPTTWFLVTLALAPPALGFIAQQLVPFVQARFFLFIVPPLAILAAAGLARLGRKGLPLAAALAVVWGLALPGALGALEGADGDLRPVAQALEDLAVPGDGVVVGQVWQEGILRMLSPDLPVDYHLGWYREDDAERELLALLGQHPRLWLLTYQSALQHPANTPGWWLEHETARAHIFDLPPYTLTLYTDPAHVDIAGTVGVSTAEAGPQVIFESGVALLESFVPQTVAAGEVLSLVLDWKATEADLADWKVFVHLVDASGQLRAQSDGAPENGLRPFASFEEGEVVEDQRALAIPADTPPGHYLVLVGLYDAESGARAQVVDGPRPGADYVTLDEVQVEPPAQRTD
jgi:4-amino-4-deoxy-L-arabinose transferase-like glycosyltransferase